MYMITTRSFQLMIGILLRDDKQTVGFVQGQLGVMYDSYLLKDVHSVLVNFPREYAQESMMLYI